jgi:ABC-2 type transport system permease protein
MFRLTRHYQKAGLIGMSAVGFFYGIFQIAAYNSAAGTSAASRAAFGRQIETFGRALSYILPLPVRADTVGGYLQWRVYGALPLLFGFWAVMSATGAGRGDEDRGLVEEWLGAGADVRRYLPARFCGFVVAAVVATAVTSAAIDIGALAGGAAPALGGVIEMSVAVFALTLACYGVGLVAAQLASSRAVAAGLGGGVLLLLFFINGFSRTVDGLHGVAAAISPFFYFDRSNPLRPGGTFDVTASAGLLAAGVALVALATWLMKRRDIGSPLLARRARGRPVTHRPSSNPILRAPIAPLLYEQRVGLLVWGLGAAAAAAFIASIGPQIVGLTSSGAFSAYLSAAGHGNPYVTVTAYFWFGIFEMVLAALAITSVARWSADDNQGRLETVLSTPTSRSRVVVERAVALTVATSAVIAVSSLALFIAARAANIGLDAGSLALASTVLLPFTLSFAAVGALLASRVPRAAVAVLGTIAFVSYLITDAGPLLKLPAWMIKSSVFSLVGTPLTAGVSWTGLLIMVGVTVGGFTAASLVMRRRDVGA